MDLTTRVNIVRNHSKNKSKDELPVSTVAALCSINRTSIYYEGTPVSKPEFECKRIIDHLHTDHPTWGARQMSAQLKMRGYHIGRKKARRYMNDMAIDPIYPKPNLSKRLKQAQVVPYLLRNAVIDRPNQAWSIDITYIPMKRGFLYLTAIIDWYSHCIVGWELDDTLDTTACIRACKKAFKVAKPLILNSDQGCQFTSSEYKCFLKKHAIKQSILNTRDINWNLRLDKNNKTNRMILSICKLVIDGFLQSEKDGKVRLEHFSESNMPALYEHFILEYYRKHFSELNASPSFVDWNSDDEVFDLLPRMRTDITLTSEDKVLIIDAKYYSHSLQENSLYGNKKSIHSGNMYQIYSYVKNKDVEHSGKVSGMLLYAKTDEEISPNQEYMLDGNRFIVRTLDLNRDFAEIAGNLDAIAKLVLE